MKLTFNYAHDVVVLPLSPLRERAKKATKTDLCLLFTLASDARLRDNYAAEADRAAAEAGFSRAELDRALSFWQGAGLIDVEGEEEAAAAPVVTEKLTPPSVAPEKKKLEREAALPNYTTEQLATLLESRADAKHLVDAAQQTFGKMFTTMEVNIVLGMMDYLSLESEYILVLLAWCRERDKRSMRYAEKMAIGLWDEGIRDAETLNAHLRRLDETEKLRRDFRSLFGAADRTLTAKEKAAFARWIDEFGYSLEIVTRAYEATVDAIGKVSIPYTDSILTRWHAEGLKTLEEIEANLSARAREKADASPVSSFDTDEMFENALRRTYS